MTDYKKLSRLVKLYLLEHPLKKPALKDAGMFLSIGVGKLLSAIMQDEINQAKDVEGETISPCKLTDCLMLVIVCSECLEVDVFQLLEDKLKIKLGESGEALANPDS